MNDKLSEIFCFLQQNRKYNKELQIKFYKGFITPYDNKESKIISLLYSIASTQSKPNINQLSCFFKFIYRR